MPLGTLYSNGPLCPFTHRVRIAAAELAAAIDVAIGEAIPAAVRDANLSGTWPAFGPDGEDFLLQDSADIIEFLISSSGAAGEAFRSEPEILATLDVLCGAFSKVMMVGEATIQRDFRGRLDRALEDVAARLGASGGPYLAGPEFSQADGHAAPFLYRLPLMLELRGHQPQVLLDDPRLADWVRRIVARPSFQAVAPAPLLLRQFYAANAT